MRNLFLWCFLVLLAACYDNVPGGVADPVERDLPSFSFRLINSNKELNTKDIAKGKPFVFFYFDPSCPYCKKQTESILRYVSELDNKFYFVSDFPEQQIKMFYDAFSLNKHSNILVAKDSNSYFANYYKPPAVPFIIIFDKNRQLKKVIIGNSDIGKIKNNLIE